jgi:hypothetical protein
MSRPRADNARKAIDKATQAIDKVAQGAFRIKAERDELLAAAKAVVALLQEDEWTGEVVDVLEAAIAKAEGRAP